MSNETIDFKDINPASESQYLNPGMYRLKVDPKATTVVAPEGKTPYLGVRFVNEKGGSVMEKFYLTKKALERIQYLHMAWFNKRLDKAFSSYPELGEYLRVMLTSKIVARPMVVGGKITPDGKFYSGLPYSGFVIADESDFEEGEFEVNSPQYNKVVRVEKPNPAVAGNNAALLPSGEGYKPIAAEDQPW